jgi:hypothetical protein
MFYVLCKAVDSHTVRRVFAVMLVDSLPSRAFEKVFLALRHVRHTFKKALSGYRPNRASYSRNRISENSNSCHTILVIRIDTKC